MATRLLGQEARALLTRVDRLQPFSLQMPMVAAAALSPPAMSAMENHMITGRRSLRRLVQTFLQWLQGAESRRTSAAECQRRFTLLRLRFNAIISQFDIFADVVSQRSQHDTGVWVAGLDDVAAEALELPGFYAAPPVVCYLDRGYGAAIRRARTRLPGGDPNPVAIIRVPRERMIGSGIASSLVHEVGHQAAELLGLLTSLRPLLRGMQRNAGPHRLAWQLWERWISEIVPDFWSVAKVGIAGPLGLLAVVSLPRAFVFRVDASDPHPSPWIRVKLGCAMGQALYPHPQWARLAALWESFYPLEGVREEVRALFATLEATLPGFVTLLIHHRPAALRGRSLQEVVATPARQPARLAAYFEAWRGSPARMRDAPPTLAFAVLGQARADGRLSPETESRMLADLLRYWAMHSALDIAEICSEQPRRRAGQPGALPAAAALSA